MQALEYVRFLTQFVTVVLAGKGSAVFASNSILVFRRVLLSHNGGDSTAVEDACSFSTLRQICYLGENVATSTAGQIADDK